MVFFAFHACWNFCPPTVPPTPGTVHPLAVLVLKASDPIQSPLPSAVFFISLSYQQLSKHNVSFGRRQRPTRAAKPANGILRFPTAASICSLLLPGAIGHIGRTCTSTAFPVNAAEEKPMLRCAQVLTGVLSGAPRCGVLSLICCWVVGAFFCAPQYTAFAPSCH